LVSAGRQDGQAVGVIEAQQAARYLIAGGNSLGESGVSLWPMQSYSVVLGPGIKCIGSGAVELRPQSRRQNRRSTSQFPTGRQDVQVRRHHGRQKIARKTENDFRTSSAKFPRNQ